MIPALMIMLLVMLCGFLPALNLVSEKETGTIEQINVTPVSRLTFTLAKLIPYWVIGTAVLGAAMLLAWIVYGLAPAGSIGAIFLAAALFVLTMSGLGVAIANRSETMQQTMFVMFFFVMIFILMSGLITPVESMPGMGAVRSPGLLPPRYFVGIMRAVYLKGYGCSATCGPTMRPAGRSSPSLWYVGYTDLQETDVGAHSRSDVCEPQTEERLETGISVEKNEFVRQDACIRKIIRIFTKLLR